MKPYIERPEGLTKDLDTPSVEDVDEWDEVDGCNWDCECDSEEDEEQTKVDNDGTSGKLEEQESFSLRRSARRRVRPRRFDDYNVTELEESSESSNVIS